ncbi:MAG: 2-isopropylmalate synthase [Planctomycetes bacterium]|nr:2-isopropylmalate synthase [Planctomycetota bacterium]
MDQPPPAPRAEDLIHDWNTVGGGDPPPGRRIRFDDETLRDGLQSPSVQTPTIEQKLEILHLMEEIGIHTANIGLPGAGPHVVRDTTELAREIGRSRMRIRANCAARTVIADIEPIHRIVQETGVPIEVAMFIGSSPIRQYTEDWSLDRMLALTEEAVRYCVDRGLDAMYVTEDTTRAHPETLRRLYGAAIACGARAVVVCDTVGHSTPEGARQVVGFVRRLIEESGRAVRLDWHGHNDRGLSVPNSIAAIRGGADQVHGCALGIGERVGNTPMDQLLVNLHLMGWVEGVNLRKLPDYCEAVSRATGHPIPDNYPMVGRDAFETGTGVHAAAVIKAFRKGDHWLANRIYSGVPAEELGREQVIKVGPMSGRSNVVWWLERHGVRPSEEVVDRVFRAAKLSTRNLADEEIRNLVEQVAYVDEWSV